MGRTGQREKEGQRERERERDREREGGSIYSYIFRYTVYLNFCLMFVIRIWCNN